MEPMKLFKKKPKVHIRYDEGADVLYLSFKQPKAAVGLDLGNGVILRYDEKNREIVGFTLQGIRGKLSDYIKQQAA